MFSLFDEELIFKLIFLTSVFIIAISFYNLEKRFFDYSLIIEKILNNSSELKDSKEFEELKAFREKSRRKTNKFNLTRFK